MALQVQYRAILRSYTDINHTPHHMKVLPPRHWIALRVDPLVVVGTWWYTTNSVIEVETVRAILAWWTSITSPPIQPFHVGVPIAAARRSQITVGRCWINQEEEEAKETGYFHDYFFYKKKTWRKSLFEILWAVSVGNMQFSISKRESQVLIIMTCLLAYNAIN